jgi:tetratricopeptide (TPR) repeat protein
MKRLFLVLGFVVVMLNLKADVYDDIKESDKIYNSEAEKNSEYWYERGEMYFLAYKKATADFVPGMNKQTLQLSKGKPTSKEPNVWYYNKIKLEFAGEILQSVIDLEPKFPNALKIAYESLSKSIETYATEDHGFFSSNYEERALKIQQEMLTFLSQDASTYYREKNYIKSMEYFELAHKVRNNKKFLKMFNHTSIDTSLAFYTAATAKLANKKDKAIEYFEYSKSMGYGGADVYNQLVELYMNLGKKEKLKTVLDEGLKKFPTSEALIIGMINVYINANKADEALVYLEEGIKVNPKNPSFHYSKGVLLGNLKKYDEAVVAYKRAFGLKPDFFGAYYSLGVMIYNQAVEISKKANLIPVNKAKEYDKLIAKSNEKFLEALPYFEKAHSLNQLDKQTIESLKTIYFRNRNKSAEMKLKYKEFLKKSNS